ncbi:o-succinylbenzoate--CoA ligase [Alteromonas gracilis]
MGRVSSLRPVSGTPEEVLELLRAWLSAAQEPPALVIETSGSTGRPKRVHLSRRAVLASAGATHARLGGPGAWSLRLPASYVAGVQVLVRSLVAGHEPALDGGVPDAERRYVSVVPTQLHRALQDPVGRADLAAFDAVLVGGGPVDADLRRRAEEAGIRTVATYGMSETCGGCVYDGRPLDGVRLRIDETDGRVLIGGDVLFEGYEDDADTAGALVDGWFRTDDLGELDADGTLRVLGRVDDVINTGGVKVPAAAVARRLREHPALDAAEVVAVPDAEWGSLVVACVVGGIGLAEARDWVAEQHPRTWAPRRLVALDALPMLATGKPDRLALEARAREEES